MNLNMELSEEGETRLRVLTEIADILGLDQLTFSSFASSVTRLSNTDLELKRSLNRLEYVEQELEGVLASTRYQEQLMTKWSKDLDQTSSGESLHDLEWRKTLLNRKAKEYEKNLQAALTNQRSIPVTISDISERRERLRSKCKELKTKRAKIEAFHGLPPNIGLAKMELQRARKEQADLIQLREQLLCKMAEGVN